MKPGDLLDGVPSLAPLDRHLARLLGGNDLRMRGMVALVSRALRSGHSCLPLSAIAKSTLSGASGEEVFGFPDVGDLERVLVGSDAVDRVHSVEQEIPLGRPLVFDGERLYFRRYYDHECAIARGIGRLAQRPLNDGAFDLEGRLRAYFPEPDDPQRDAVLGALGRRVSLITGGPGTGKTTTVVKMLALSIESAQARGHRLRTSLLAPTGKAAERLLQATRKAAARLELDEAVRRELPTEAKTIHRALGTVAGLRTRFRHTKARPLGVDLVVVDEASMVDLALMSRLLDALPDDSRLVLLGDADQLSSVEAGSVLGELAKADLRLQGEHRDFAFGSSVLTKSYRFAGAPAIMELAAGFRSGEPSRIERALQGGTSEAAFLDMSGHDSWTHVPECREWLEERLELLLRSASVEEALAGLEKSQVLCSLRGGPFGTAAINDWVTKKALSKRSRQQGTHYRGRRILVTENDPRVGLYNGDIGIVWPSVQGALLAHFPGDSGTMRSFSIAELPAHDDAFAITIHKSQGSEYDDVLLMIHAQGGAELLTRELLYTGLTRARKSVTLVGEKSVLLEAATRRVQRYSGLAERLVQVARMSSSTV